MFLEAFMTKREVWEKAKEYWETTVNTYKEHKQENKTSNAKSKSVRVVFFIQYRINIYAAYNIAIVFP